MIERPYMFAIGLFLLLAAANTVGVMIREGDDGYLRFIIPALFIGIVLTGSSINPQTPPDA